MTKLGYSMPLRESDARRSPVQTPETQDAAARGRADAPAVWAGGPRLLQQHAACSAVASSPRLARQGQALQCVRDGSATDRAPGPWSGDRGKGVIQGFGLLAGVALAGLGLAAYGAYRWWRGGTRPAQEDDANRGYFNVGADYDSAEDSDYEPDAEDDWDDTAEDRLARMHARGQARRARGRIPSGRYQTPTGMATLSGVFGQRMSQTRQADYGGHTFGSLPPYAGLQTHIPFAAIDSLGHQDAAVPVGLTNRQRNAVALGHTLANGSEEDRAEGYSGYHRAVLRDYTRTGGQGAHPFSQEMYPARTSAQAARDLMEGNTELSAQQRRALEEDSELSSDSDDDYYLRRY